MYQLHRGKTISGATPLISARAEFQHLQFLCLVYINGFLGLGFSWEAIIQSPKLRKYQQLTGYECFFQDTA